MNKDCKVSIERDANGSLSVLLTGHKDDIRMLWTMTERSCCWMRPTALMARFFHCYDGAFLLLDEADRFDGAFLSLPEKLCVGVRFHGHHLQSPEQYRRLEQFIWEHYLQIVGFSREVTLIDYGITNDTEKFVTEICIPVTEEE